MKTAELRVTDTAGNHQFAIVDDSTGQDIAIVYNRDEESKKTAQLLAAAPELFEIASDILDKINTKQIDAKNGIVIDSYTWHKLNSAMKCDVW